jgi:myo-inositol-1-phosphate synthase
MNVIPEGALHARKNGMELAKEGEVTHKGIPVVDNDGNQQAEIERNEIIFNKEVTEKLENYYKQYNSDEKSQSEKDEIAIKAGKLLAK